MANGTYAIAYCGANAIGIGVFTVTGGRLEGYDSGNVRYEGTVTESPDGLDSEISLDIPAGATLVSGTSPQDVAHGRPIRHKFPPNFGDGEPQKIAAPFGDLNVMIKRIPDDYAVAARGGFTMAIARQIGLKPPAGP